MTLTLNLKVNEAKIPNTGGLIHQGCGIPRLQNHNYHSAIK